MVEWFEHEYAKNCSYCGILPRLRLSHFTRKGNQVPLSQCFRANHSRRTLKTHISTSRHNLLNLKSSVFWSCKKTCRRGEISGNASESRVSQEKLASWEAERLSQPRPHNSLPRLPVAPSGWKRFLCSWKWKVAFPPAYQLLRWPSEDQQRSLSDGTGTATCCHIAESWSEMWHRISRFC